MTRRPRSCASFSRRLRFLKSNWPGFGSAVAQSTQHLTVLNPTALIWSRSLPQRSALVASTGSSIGARALPPPYHTATGKKGVDADSAGGKPGASAAHAMKSVAIAPRMKQKRRLKFLKFIRRDLFPDWISVWRRFGSRHAPGNTPREFHKDPLVVARIEPHVGRDKRRRLVPALYQARSNLRHQRHSNRHGRDCRARCEFFQHAFGI